MIYNRLDGTTSKQFQIGKKGVELQDDEGKLVIQEHNGPARAVGIENIRLSTASDDDLPTTGAVRVAIDSKIRTLTAADLANYYTIVDEVKTNDYIFLEKGGNV